jgi:PTS system nitrogen regulatory IIA component
MPLNDLLTLQAVVPALKVNSKKQALQELAARASAICGRGEREVLDVLAQRERLGSTGIGSGIAIPHGKLPKLERLFGLFARLERPVDFEALDGQPVDLMFLLLAPEAAGADHATPNRFMRCSRPRHPSSPASRERELSAVRAKQGVPPLSRSTSPRRKERALATLRNLCWLSARSMHADGLQFVRPGIGDRRFAGVGDHDRGAVGGV